MGEHRLRAILRTVYKHNLDATIAFKSRQCGGVVGTFFFVPKGIRWNKIERGAGDEAEPLNSRYLLVHVVLIKWRVALAQQKPVHTSQYVIYDDIAIN